MPVPPVPGWPLWLYDVEAIAVDDVWAVGFTTVEAAHEPLILHWDGEQWSRVLDGVQPDARQVVGVSASSASDVWAVGEIIAGTSLVQRWDGRGWTRDASSDLPTRQSFLTAVAMLPDGQTWAVGAASNKPYAVYLCPVPPEE
jgi:hypothetical protein